MPVHPSHLAGPSRASTPRPGPQQRGMRRGPVRRPTGWLTAAATAATACAALSALPAQPAFAATTAAAEVGPRPHATRLSFTVGDRITATVDVGSGNLEVTTTDLTLPGIGKDLQLGLDYNGLLLTSGSPLPAGAAGAGWAMRFGTDNKIVNNADGSALYLGADGVEYLFTPGATAGSYVSPPAADATLTGSSTSGWDLAEHTSGDTWHFGAAGRLTSRTDRNGQATQLTYTTGGGPLTSITSTRGNAGSNNTAKVSISGGLLQSLTQQSTGTVSRSVTYGYTSGQLTSLTDTAGRVTTFGYSTAGDLTSITNTGGAVTQFTVNAAHKVTKVTQLNPSTGSPGDSITRLSYPSASQTLLADPDSDQTLAVANTAHTTYTIDAATGSPSAVDADGNTRTAGYTGDYDVNATSIGTRHHPPRPAAPRTAPTTARPRRRRPPPRRGATPAWPTATPPPAPSTCPPAAPTRRATRAAYSYDTAGNPPPAATARSPRPPGQLTTPTAP